MPWTARDAHRHKRGLSARQARQWAAVANSMLRRCLSDGGTQSTCEARAIRGANSAVGTPELSTEQRRLTVETALTVPPQRLTVNGRELLTAPVVMLVSGVLNNGLIEGEELHPADWNGVPVTVQHPIGADGTPMSARTPGVLAVQGVGHVYHARLGSGQRGSEEVAALHGELWLDVAQMQTLGGEALQALNMLETQTPLEVSTGFYSETTLATGTFYGTPYSEVHHQLRPDHLALLPNGVGACSWTDGGCGAPRLHEHQGCACAGTCTCGEGETMDHPPTFMSRLLATLRLLPQEGGPPLLAIQETDTDTREALYSALAREMGTDYTPIFIDAVDMSAHTFTYRQGERLLQRGWRTEGETIVLDEGSQDVQRHTTYTPVTTEEEHTMPSAAVQARVTALIRNPRTAWEESDRAILETMNEAQLDRLSPEPPEEPPTEPDEEPEPEEEEPTQAVSVEVAIQQMPPEVRAPLLALAKEHRRRKQHAITTLTAAKYPLTATRLEGLELSELEGLVATLRPGSARRQVNYEGQGMPSIPAAGDSGVPDPPDTLGEVVKIQRAAGILR